MKVALVTGITGQDGFYLAEYLNSLDYKIFGLVRGQNNPKLEELSQELPYVHVIHGDLLDATSLNRAITISDPDEIYNLGAISYVGLSWNQPINTSMVTALGTLNLLESVRNHISKKNKIIKFYQASSSEMFGDVRQIPQDENTPFYPRSPYGVAKTFAHYMTVNYRESYGIFASCGILFNHESPKRGLEFVSRKITDGVAKIYLGLKEHLVLGNLDSRRDWGFAGDYVVAMHKMLQVDSPGDFVIATGIDHSVKDLVEVAFKSVGIDDWIKYVKFDQNLIRPAEVNLLRGDYGKAKKVLNWQPMTSFENLINLMVDSDVKRIKRQIG